jgi:hypothetical protein
LGSAIGRTLRSVGPEHATGLGGVSKYIGSGRSGTIGHISANPPGSFIDDRQLPGFRSVRSNDRFAAFPMDRFCQDGVLAIEQPRHVSDYL